MNETKANETNAKSRLDNTPLYEDFVVDCPELSDRIDVGLAELEAKFAAFVTPDSLRTSLGVGRKR